MKKIIVTWSGGIDSTALVGLLLRDGWDVHTLYLKIYGDNFTNRELEAREKILPFFKERGLVSDEIVSGNFLWRFSPDGREIPNRNRLIIDFLVANYGLARNFYHLGLGEYIGADSWVVTDHVPMTDADARSLSSYIFYNYGLRFRLLTLADFGESRFKSDRVALLASVLHEKAFDTTNCLNDSIMQCGECYKCVERHVALMKIFGEDKSVYKTDPWRSKMFKEYEGQMHIK